MAQKKLTSITDMTDFKYPLDYAIASIGGTLGKISGDALKDYYVGLSDGSGAETAIARSEAAAVAISEAQDTLDAAAEAIGAEDEEDMEDIIAYAGVHTDGSNLIANAWMERLGYGCLIFTTTEENEEVRIIARSEFLSAMYIDGKEIDLSDLESASETFSGSSTTITDYPYSHTFEEAGEHAVWIKIDTTQASLTALFYNCTAMTEVKVSPFRLCTATTNFSSTFRYCTGLVTIPSGMFDYCTSATTFSQCFLGCYALQEIPDGLFDNNLAVTSFSNCFQECYSLTSIPDGLFAVHEKVTAWRYLFNQCYSLPRIASDANISLTSDIERLFNGCSAAEVITFTGLGTQESCTMTDAFYNCTLWGSTDEGLESLVDSLLTNSFDRATAGYDALTITLPSAVYARLSDDEVNSIVAKGFTLTTE